MMTTLMEPSSVRLLIEAALVTAGFIGLVAVMSWSVYQTRRRTPGAIVELTASNDELARRVRNLERGREQDHLTLLRLQTRLEIQTAYSRALAAYADTLASKLRELGQDVPAGPGNPPTPPSDLAEPLRSQPFDPRLIALALAEHFDKSELVDLAFRLGVNEDELQGESAGARARALVRYMQRRERLDELVALARLLRPGGGF